VNKWRFPCFFGILPTKGAIVSCDTEGQAWVETWARRIETLGLSPVVLVLIEIAHAFGFLGSQALLMAQPLVTGMVNDATLERTATLLDSPELLDRLRGCLEGEES
jgi:uncharacterized membrane protein